MKWATILSLICFSTVVYGGDSFAFYQEQIEELSRNATIQLQSIRASHRIEITKLTQMSLKKIGEFTTRGRRRTEEALDYIDSFNGELSDGQKVCLEEAYAAQNKYARVLGDDLSHCASNVYNETTVDALEHFQKWVGNAQYDAFLALNQALVAFEVESTANGRERHLREAYNWVSMLWQVYSVLLNRKLEEQRSHFEEVTQFIEMCLEQALFFFNNTIEYVKDELEECFTE